MPHVLVGPTLLFVPWAPIVVRIGGAALRYCHIDSSAMIQKVQL